MRQSRSFLPVFTLMGLGLLVAPSTAQVQPVTSSQSPLQGVVVDEATYQAVASATVTMVGSSVSVTTDGWGSFAFPDPPLGLASVHVAAPGYTSIVQDVEVVGGRVVFARFVLSSVATVLSELRVRVSPPPNATTHGRTAADLLALQFPAMRVWSGVDGPPGSLTNLRAKGTLTGSTQPLVLIDGVVMSRERAFDALVDIRADDVAEIEVLRGPSAAFLYPLAANGVVHVRTKRGPRP